MFTRYSGVDVPQNYSGNRFRKKTIEDTETKVHSSTLGATKSSISPSFEKQLNQQFDEESDFQDTENSIENNEYILDESNSCERNDSNTSNNNVFKELSSFSNYFKNIKNDDLLLIALIIFLASDKGASNNDIIILLSLLLIYHT